MRMWMIKPKLLCDKHLLGEHGELHKHRHTFVKKHSISGRIFPIAQIEPLSMQNRHAVLAKEMLIRGFKHQSPYVQPSLTHLKKEELSVKVDVDQSIKDLASRCIECKKRIKKKFYGYLKR